MIMEKILETKVVGMMNILNEKMNIFIKKISYFKNMGLIKLRLLVDWTMHYRYRKF
jgi:hypothetical protein